MILISMDKIALSIVQSCQILYMKPPKAIVDASNSHGFLPTGHLFDLMK